MGLGRTVHGAVGLLASMLAALVASSPSPEFGTGHGDGDTAFTIDGVLDGSLESGGIATATSDDGQLVEFVRAPACASSQYQMARDPVCLGNDPNVVICLDGTPALEPIWSRRQASDGTWGSWIAVSWYTCPGDADLLAAIEREWTQLRPAPSTIELQPNTGWVIANVPTVAMAEDAPRLHATTLLGAGVEIRATPSGYVWNWGDGAQTSTTDPGRPHPHATLTHTYPHASGNATVGLTTTWTGEYRVNGGPWIDFSSTISSDADPVVLTVHDPRSGLVDCDLVGNCRLSAQR